MTASQNIFDWTEADFLTTLKNAANTAQLTTVGEVSFSFQPQGISAVILLKESHVALHFWPEAGKISIDIHVCDYQQYNYIKAEILAKLLAFQVSENDSIEHWKYLFITG